MITKRSLLYVLVPGITAVVLYRYTKIFGMSIVDHHEPYNPVELITYSETQTLIFDWSSGDINS